MTENKKDKKEKDTILPTATSLTPEEKSSFATSLPKVPGFQILSTLGEGGCGIVYLADQKEPVKRRVALKVIKPGMDSKQVIARFEAERQALALLDHPNISRVFSAGTTEAGRPYFVMEYVKGVPITEHCDRHKLKIEDRLDLFLQVCDAIQHAHQKGIIHRDIKPSNILVSIEGDNAILKVIDFGVAKAISQPLTERTLFTEQGQLIGTPEYMSPEQAEMTAQNIDTRSDIYSLGVLLYELLTGTLPFDKDTLRKAAFGEIQRIIRQQDPPKPSTRLSSLGEDATQIAQSRRTKIGVLIKRLHKELEWIPLKAMRKEPNERYRSASEFADDIQNYLKGVPLIAGPESATYRIKKLIRKHRGAVAAMLAVFAALLVGFVVSTMMYFQAEQARKEAVRQAEISQAVTNFVTEDVLALVGPHKAQGRQVTVPYLLETASKNLQEKFKNAPLIEASIHNMLGRIYTSLSEYDTAEQHFQRALQLLQEQLGDEHSDTLFTLIYLAQLKFHQGRYDKLEPILVKALNSAIRLYGREHQVTAALMVNLGTLYRERYDKYDEAESLFVESIDIYRRITWEESLSTLSARLQLGGLYIQQGRFNEAEPILVECANTLRRVFGEKYPDTLHAVNALAWLYREQGRYDEAEAVVVDNLVLLQQVFGKESSEIADAATLLGSIYSIQKRYEEAESAFLKGYDLRKRTLGENHRETVGCIHCLIDIYEQWGKPEKAAEWRAKLPNETDTEKQ